MDAHHRMLHCGFSLQRAISICYSYADDLRIGKRNPTSGNNSRHKLTATYGFAHH